MTDLVTRIAELERELDEASQQLALAEAATPAGQCGVARHTAALNRIPELEAALAAARSGSSERRAAFMIRIGAERADRRRADIVRLEAQIAEARSAATGDRALLATLKQLRRERDEMIKEIQALKAASR